MQHQPLLDIVRRDPRYPYEAYEFLFEALGHTQRRLGRVPPQDLDLSTTNEYHVAGPELVDGFLDLARDRFGRLARIVLQLWGVNKTDDVGELVFNLIEGEMLSKNDDDCKTHFHNLCDLDDTLLNRFEIAWER